jgi:hypothetical protein
MDDMTCACMTILADGTHTRGDGCDDGTHGNGRLVS